MIDVRSIKSEQTYEWLLNKHYAKRIPSISYSFGLFENDILSGIITYGTPASSSLRKGICGIKYKDEVIELNRLCLNIGIKNAASILISKSIKMLPRPLIIVSYADISMGHVGYVYQSTNWIYTGLSAKRTDWKIKGMEHLHGATIADKSRGKKNRSEYMRDQYGDDFYLEDRPRKHRYIYIIGTKRQKKERLKALNYPILPYPKGESKKYDASYNPTTQLELF